MLQFVLSLATHTCYGVSTISESQGPCVVLISTEIQYHLDKGTVDMIYFCSWIFSAN